MLTKSRINEKTYKKYHQHHFSTATQVDPEISGICWCHYIVSTCHNPMEMWQRQQRCAERTLWDNCRTSAKAEGHRPVGVSFHIRWGTDWHRQARLLRRRSPYATVLWHPPSGHWHGQNRRKLDNNRPRYRQDCVAGGGFIGREFSWRSPYPRHLWKREMERSRQSHAYDKGCRSHENTMSYPAKHQQRRAKCSRTVHHPAAFNGI